MPNEPFKPDDIVKTCCKLESGLFLGSDGLRPCSRGALRPPILCKTDELVQTKVTKEIIMGRRKNFVAMLNDDTSDIDCKRCLLVESKRFKDIDFSKLDHIDLQHYTVCNLRCTYCHYTRENWRLPPQYDALEVLRQFSPEDIEWNAHVDFAGGEPTLLQNLEEYLEFFRSRRIRVLMHTNGVLFHQAIYDGLADGTLFWVTVSVDAGTPSTYKALRGGDYYLQVLENLSRYAVAGSKGKGMLSVKYIFCESNCGDDDIAGFAYAMLALRPQKVWLNLDFTPLYLRSGYDYSKEVKAYAKLYLLLKKHGIEAFHYFREAVATYSKEGNDIMEAILVEIQEQSASAHLNDPDLLFKDFRNNETVLTCQPDTFSTDPLRVSIQGGPLQSLSLADKRVLLVPASPRTQRLLSDPDIQRAQWIGLIDRNPIQQGKVIEGRTIYGYEAIPSLEPDIILVVPPEKHRIDILNAIRSQAPDNILIAELR